MHDLSRLRLWSRVLQGVFCCSLVSQLYTIYGLSLRIYNFPQILLG